MTNGLVKASVAPCVAVLALGADQMMHAVVGVIQHPADCKAQQQNQPVDAVYSASVGPVLQDQIPKPGLSQSKRYCSSANHAVQHRCRSHTHTVCAAVTE